MAACRRRSGSAHAVDGRVPVDGPGQRRPAGENVRRLRFVGPVLAGLLVALGSTPLLAQEAAGAPRDPLRRHLLGLRRLDTEGRVLYVTAHPDDEDSGAIAYFAQGRGFQVTLLTLTRGEGGQNEIGEELFEALGVLRMRELDQVHRYDGARQLFSRAFEFGYSFSEEETFAKWGADEIVDDLVRVIRAERPQVILTMASKGAGGGRHHEASARLAQRAFEVAATDARPELGAPFSVARLFEQAGPPPEGKPDDAFVLPVHDYDAILGTTYARLGFQARSVHRCQGTPRVDDPKAPRRESRWRLVLFRGERPERSNDLFAGLPVTKPPSATRADPTDLEASLKSLATSAANSDAVGERARRLLAQSWPLEIDARATRADLVPGETLQFQLRLTNHARSRATLDLVRLGLLQRDERGARALDLRPADLEPGETVRFDLDYVVPEDLPSSGVRFRRDPAVDRYAEADPEPPHESAVAVFVRATLHGIPCDLPPTPVWCVDPDRRRGLVIRPSIEATLLPRRVIAMLAPGTVDAGRRIVGHVKRAPSPAGARTVALEDEHGRLVATTTGDTLVHELGPLAGSGRRSVVRRFRAVVDEEGTRRPLVSLREITYPHLERAHLEEEAVSELVVIDGVPPVSVRIGYLGGAGDLVDDAMSAAGWPFVRLDSGRAAEFDSCDVVVVGVRAYRTRAALRSEAAGIERWMRERGGHLVVLYQRPEDVNVGEGESARWPEAPLPARAGRGRTTVEESPVRLRRKDHPFFTTPNRLDAADFAGWVQERGTYYFEALDPGYEDLLELEDPHPANAGPKGGALVTAKVGKGRFTYVGLTLFRQLPTGVPGAWRLFANLLSLR